MFANIAAYKFVAIEERDALRVGGIDPVGAPAPLLPAAELKRWYEEGRDFAILKYFEECGGAHWRGNCVVFDQRGALDPRLLPAEQRQNSD